MKHGKMIRKKKIRQEYFAHKEEAIKNQIKDSISLGNFAQNEFDSNLMKEAKSKS